MAAAAIPKSELVEVDINLIKVKDGFNARVDFDPDELQALSETVEDVGVTQTVRLRPIDDGFYELVAGGRRYRGAKAAGLKKIPAMVGELSEREALLIAWIENRHRSNLNPIEEAQALKAVAEEFELTTQKEIAEKASVKLREVGPLLRLLDLPEGAQRLIASGHVPKEAEKRLREVAAISPRAAECVCEFAKRKEVSHTEFLRSFDELLKATSGAKFNANPPTLIPAWRPALHELVRDRKAREALRDRYSEVTGHDHEDPAFNLGEEEIDTARAAGCLIEPPPRTCNWGRGNSYITDQELAADLAVCYVERLEKKIEQQREAEAKEAEARAAKGEDGESQEDKAAAARKEAYAERKEATEDAIDFNDEFGVKLMKHRGGKTRKQRSTARGKAIALLAVAQNEELAARGLRLVMPQLQRVEQKELKSGKLGKPKTVYASTEECVNFLNRRIEAAGTDAEVNEVLAEALIAGMEADANATTQADRAHWWLPDNVEPAVRKLLAPDIKDVRPRRRAAKKRK